MKNNSITKRELYIDVVVSESEVEEIFLYQVDFAQGESFRAKEYLYQLPIPTEEPTEEEEQPDLMDQFYEQLKTLLMEKIPTELFATDAVSVMAYLIEPLQKRYPSYELLQKREDEEPLHDCISMVRVVSMSVFDEKQHLSSGIRRRMKEKYHTVVDEVKRVKPAHLFLTLTEAEEHVTSIDIILADDKMNIKKGYNLKSKASEETIAVKLYEILRKYPEADILTDGINRNLYRILQNMTLFIDESLPTVRVYSLQSMMLALGKNTWHVLDSIMKERSLENIEVSTWVTLYQEYIKNSEELRLERFQDETVYRIHKFFLPIRLSSAESFLKLMKKNSVWFPTVGENETYQMKPEKDELSAKYKIAAGDEQFILKVNDITCTRYLNNYAVICIEAENHFYPGKVDCERIDELGSTLYPMTSTEDGIVEPIHLELKMKLQGRVYALSSIAGHSNSELQELWLNGLFLLGKDKLKKNETVSVTTVSDRMFVLEDEPCTITYKKAGINSALIKTECYHRMETKLALTATQIKAGIRPGKLNHKQKAVIKQLFEYYRYLRTSFGVEWEITSDTKEATLVNDRLHTEKLAERLGYKFSLYKTKM